MKDKALRKMLFGYINFSDPRVDGVKSQTWTFPNVDGTVKHKIHFNVNNGLVEYLLDRIKTLEDEILAIKANGVSSV